MSVVRLSYQGDVAYLLLDEHGVPFDSFVDSASVAPAPRAVPYPSLTETVEEFSWPE